MILWMDGPDHYGSDASLLLNGVYAEVTQVGLQLNSGPGGQGTTFTFNGGGSSQGCRLRKVLPGNRNLVGVGYRINLDSIPPVSTVIHEWVDAGNAVVGSLFLTPTGALVLIVGAATVYTSGPELVANSWQHIEAKLKIGASGSWAINVNGIPIASSDSQDFHTSNQIAQVNLRNSAANAAGHKKRDFYIWDDQGDENNSGMQGDRQVNTSMSTADGAEQQWLYSSGTHGFPLINEIPPNDASYVYANTPGQKSNFTMAPIDTDITSISAVMLVARAAKSDAGIGTMALNIGSIGSTGAGAEQALSTEFIYYSQIFEKDPHTGTKWTATGVNAAQPELDRIQ